MSIIRRISFFGGPGVGKSSLAAKTFAELKADHYDCEHVSEYIKSWAHEGRKPQSYDQCYVFAKQLRTEDLLLRCVPLIVTDSPLLLNTAYSTLYQFSAAPELVQIAKKFEADFPSLNLFIERTVDYQEKGRYQNQDEAVVFDKFLKDFLSEHIEDLHFVSVDKFDEMMGIIEECLN
jgi:nicotinamide riboside kinase